jgi:hypothetical protein
MLGLAVMGLANMLIRDRETASGHHNEAEINAGHGAYVRAGLDTCRASQWKNLGKLEAFQVPVILLSGLLSCELKETVPSTIPTLYGTSSRTDGRVVTGSKDNLNSRDVIFHREVEEGGSKGTLYGHSTEEQE